MSFLNPPRAQALFRRIPADTPIVGVEVGVFCGRTSLSLLGRFKQLHLHMVDPWYNWPEDSAFAQSGGVCEGKQFNQTTWDSWFSTLKSKLRPFEGRYTIHRETSAEAAPKFEGEADFVFIDANHTYAYVEQDIRLWAPLVRIGGFLSGHDYDNPIGDNFAKPWGVKRAVDEFAARNGARVETDIDFTWFIKKTGPFT